VAWGGIEPPTQGFSTLSDRVLPVHFQALTASEKVGARVSAVFYTLKKVHHRAKVFFLFRSFVSPSFR